MICIERRECVQFKNDSITFEIVLSHFGSKLQFAQKRRKMRSKEQHPFRKWSHANLWDIGYCSMIESSYFQRKQQTNLKQKMWKN